MEQPQVLVLADDAHAPLRMQVDQLDAEQRGIEDEVAGGVKDNVGQAHRVGLLEVPLDRHPSTKLHVRQLLSHVMQLDESR